MIGDGQPVALCRPEQVLARHAEVAEPQPVIVQVPQREQAVGDDLEVLVLVVGQVDDQDGGPLLDQADQADRPAGDGVGDEQLLAVDDIVIAVELGRVRSAVRSEPAPGSVSAKAESRSPLASSGRYRSFCSGVPKVRSGSTAPMQPWTDASPARLGSIVAIWVRKRANAANEAPPPPYSRVDQQAPVAGGGQIVEDRVGRPSRRGRRRSPASRWRRTASSDSRMVRSQSGEVAGGCGQEQVDRDLVVPDRPMDRAVGRLVPRGEQGLDLVVGPVERAGSSALPPRSCRPASARLSTNVWASGSRTWVSIGKPRRYC